MTTREPALHFEPTGLEESVLAVTARILAGRGLRSGFLWKTYNFNVVIRFERLSCDVHAVCYLLFVMVARVGFGRLAFLTISIFS